MNVLTAALNIFITLNPAFFSISETSLQAGILFINVPDSLQNESAQSRLLIIYNFHFLRVVPCKNDMPIKHVIF